MIGFIDWLCFLIAPPRCLHCFLPLQEPVLFCKECGEWLFLSEKDHNFSDELLVVFDQEGPGLSLTTSLHSRSSYEHLASWMVLRWLQKKKDVDYVYPLSSKEKPLCSYFKQFLNYRSLSEKGDAHHQTVLLLVCHLHDVKQLFDCLQFLSKRGVGKIWILTGTMSQNFSENETFKQTIKDKML